MTTVRAIYWFLWERRATGWTNRALRETGVSPIYHFFFGVKSIAVARFPATSPPPLAYCETLPKLTFSLTQPRAPPPAVLRPQTLGSVPAAFLSWTTWCLWLHWKAFLTATT